MTELQAIIDTWTKVCRSDSRAVLATVVHVEGSAYRRPGARMLLLSDGSRVGSVSGGCLEHDVCRKAWWLTADGKPAVQVYDTHSDDDAVWEFGLGCNGIVHVMLERLDSPDAWAAMEFLAAVDARRGEAVILTAICARADVLVGNRYWLDDTGVCGGSLAAGDLASSLHEIARDTFKYRASCLAHLPSGDFFVEWIAPPPPLVIFGAGHDVIPVATLAKQVGWHVTVVDTRAGYASAERFPDVDRIAVTAADDPIGDIEIGPQTAVVVMTHSFPLDEVLVPRLARLNPRYLGVLGARTRAERLIATIESTDTTAHAPIGLDIGADTPETVALAIVAEIQAVLAGRSAQPLIYRGAPMHDPVIEIGQSESRGQSTTIVECGISR